MSKPTAEDEAKAREFLSDMELQHEILYAREQSESVVIAALASFRAAARAEGEVRGLERAETAVRGVLEDQINRRQGLLDAAGPILKALRALAAEEGGE